MQSQLNPNTRKKRTPKIVRKPQRSGNKIEQEDKDRWKLDVLPRMFVTRAVLHFEMSPLNARAT